MVSKVLTVCDPVEKEVRFFSDQIVIRGKDDSISKGSGVIVFDSTIQTDTGLFFPRPDQRVEIDLINVVQSPIVYTFNGVEKTSSGAELLTMMKIVYENALNSVYS